MYVSRQLIALAILVFLAACTALRLPTFSDDIGAIRGYDPVAYHTEMTAVKGDPAYTYVYNDAQWHFSSERNLDLFRSDPPRFAPEYGGYCAYAMSRGLVVSIDPEAWKIADGKLYLNYSAGVRETWLEDVPGNIARANAHWQAKVSRRKFE
jgi:YHS domain-containing protein